MLKKLKNSLVMLLLLVLVTGCVNQGKVRVKDGELKIAATSVAVTEILEALEVPSSQVVAIPTTNAYSVPKIYQDAKELGTAMAPDMEILATIKPDLILSPNSLEGDLAPKYEKIKISSSFLNLKSVSGMFKSIEELGKVLDKEDKAKELVNQYVDYMTSFRDKYQNQSSPRVLILMGLPGGSYVVASESSYVGDLVRLAGGTNVYGDGNGQDFINVNVEDMLRQNPDIILRTSHAMPQEVMASFKTEFSENKIWSQFEAVKNNKVYDLDNNYFGMSANFNYQKGLEKLEEILYGSN
ncbi:MAG: heme ABC transporter substrate-binding protein IsdE [Thomasclavelia sp.]